MNIPKSNVDDVIEVIRRECDYVPGETTHVNASGWQAIREKEKLEKGLNVT